MVRTNWFWMVPFICFLGGYVAISYRMQQKAIAITPQVMGMSIQKGLFLLSELHLSGTVIGEREDAELPPGTIIDQVPAAGQAVRPLQAVGLIVTKEPSYPAAPLFIGAHEEKAIESAVREGFRARIHRVPLSGPQGMVCAQSPQAGDPVVDRIIDVYIVQGATPLRMMPSLCGLSRDRVQQICADHGITVQVYHRTEIGAEHRCSCVVVEHRPTAGALLDISHACTVQVMMADE